MGLLSLSWLTLFNCCTSGKGKDPCHQEGLSTLSPSVPNYFTHPGRTDPMVLKIILGLYPRALAVRMPITESSKAPFRKRMSALVVLALEMRGGEAFPLSQ